jgi:hypothetical protein
MKNYADLWIKTVLQPAVMLMENARKQKSPYRVSIVCFRLYPVAVPSRKAAKRRNVGQDSSKATG